MQAGSDFIKTSTGKEPTNATIGGSLVMVRAIRQYYEQTGVKVGFKPAGGIRTAKQALDWLILMKEELGDEWMQPHLFRIGASALINDIERQLEHYAYGRYASMQYQPLRTNVSAINIHVAPRSGMCAGSQRFWLMGARIG